MNPDLEVSVLPGRSSRRAPISEEWAASSMHLEPNVGTSVIFLGQGVEDMNSNRVDKEEWGNQADL